MAEDEKKPEERLDNLIHEAREPLTIPSRTNKELKQLAYDIVNGKVFTDRHIPKTNPELIYSVFIALAWLDDIQFADMQKATPGLVYEYMDKAGPMAVNGMPMFTSLNWLTQEDAKKVLNYVEVIREKVDKMLKEEDNEAVSTEGKE